MNVGTDVGSLVLDVSNATADAADEPVPYDMAPRRTSDPVSTYAYPTFAETTPGWQAQCRLKALVTSAHAWHGNQVELGCQIDSAELTTTLRWVFADLIRSSQPKRIATARRS